MKPYPLTSLLQWASRHPIQVALFSCWFSVIATALAFREDWLWPGLALFSMGLAAWSVSVLRHFRATLLMTLAIALTLQPAKAEQNEAVPIAVGVVVICVGGVCVYKAVKFCSRKFPKSTNAPPSLTASGSDEIAAAYEYSSPGSCYVPPDGLSLQEDPTQNPTTFTLGVTVHGESVTTTMSANNAEGTTQDWTGFATEMAQHGLHLTGRAQSAPQYAQNGVPCDSGAVPLWFDPVTGRIVHDQGGQLRRVVVERSVDLENWSHLLTTDVSDGSKFAIVDVSRFGQGFYRVSVGTP